MDLTSADLTLIEQYLRKNLTEEELAAGHFLDREPDKAVRVQLAEIDLEFFNRFYLSHHFTLPPAPIHRTLTQRLQYLIDTPGRRNGVYVMPRGHAKTTIATLGLPMWCVGFNKRKHIPIVSDSFDQAKDQLQNIKNEIEDNDRIGEDFGSLKGALWQAADIMASNGVRLRALGQGMKIRGRKIRAHRPDLIICHEKGTLIDCDEGHIMVEEHSTAHEHVSDGYRLRVHGLPFEETVTPEHRYWTWKNGEQGWREAQELDKSTYIGWPIAVNIETSRPIEGYERCVTITERRDNGQILATAPGHLRPVEHPWFADEEFWWLLGLWSGDGSVGPSNIALLVSPAQNATIGERIASFLHKHSKAFSVRRVGVTGHFVYVFSDTALARWLKTWIYGRHLRRAPDWVLLLPHNFHAAFLKGHIDANGYVDMKGNSVRITSISLPLLLQLRAMLARLGICASIRKGPRAQKGVIRGREINCAAKYDLRFRDGASLLGFPIPDQTRYRILHQFISDGFLWSKVREINHVPSAVFVAISTTTGVYTTAYGLSHNCDDLEELQGVQSPTQRSALLKWFQGSLMRSGWKDTKVVVLGNYLHHDCLLKNLVLNPLFDSLIFKALEEWPDRMDLWDQWRAIAVNLGDPFKERHALEFYKQHEKDMLQGARCAWPEGFPLYDLMLIRISEGEASFEMELQNNPQDPDKQLFTYYGTYESYQEGTDVWLRPLSGRPAARLSECALFAFTDPSMGATTRSDYSAIVILAKSGSGQMFVLEGDVKRRPPQEIMVAQNNYATIYRITRWGIENNQFQALFSTESAKISAEKGIYLPVVAVNQLSNKAMRIQSLQPDLENQYILFPEHGMELLKQQLREWPSGAHDDGPDALEGARTLAKEWSPLSGQEIITGELHGFGEDSTKRLAPLGQGDDPWAQADATAEATIRAWKLAQQEEKEAEPIPQSTEELLRKILTVGTAFEE